MSTTLPVQKRQELETILDEAYAHAGDITPHSVVSKDWRKAVEETLDYLDAGVLRVADKVSAGSGPNSWRVHEFAKKAVLLSFRMTPTAKMAGGVSGTFWYDKVASKFVNWQEAEFVAAGFRAVPGCYVRRSAFIGKNVVLMPSFVNVGAYVDEGTMVDTWVTVGSCAQIGKRVHLSGGVGIGGVLEPLQGRPTIIEDDCFIGARSEVVEGVIIGQGSVLAMGVFISRSTKIVDRETGAIHQGYVPPYSVVVPGALPSDKKMPDGASAPALSCAVIVKTVDAQTRAKTSINDLLRA